MVSVCLPSDALLQHLPSYLGSSYLGRGGISSRLLLSLDEGYLLTATIPDPQRGIAPLGPPAPAQRLLLGMLLPAADPDLRCGVAPLGRSRAIAAWHSRLLPLTLDLGYPLLRPPALSAPALP